MQIQGVKHPVSGVEITGLVLVPGAVLRSGDRYNSTDGKWHDCPVIGGHVPQGDHVIWIRPGGVTAGAKDLLRDLFYAPCDRYRFWSPNGELVGVGSAETLPCPATHDVMLVDEHLVSKMQELIDFGHLAFDTESKTHALTQVGRATADRLTSADIQGRF